MIKPDLESTLNEIGNIVVGKAGCPYCKEAIVILATKQCSFLYIDKEKHPKIAEDVKKKHGHSTYPAIFIKKEFIGGCSDLQEKCDKMSFE
jgi:glutaredoxin